MKRKILYTLLSISIIFSCTHKAAQENGTEQVIPKTTDYLTYKDGNISFQFSNLAKIQPVDSNTNPGSWFNIYYPDYNATLYCSFLPITQENIQKALEDSYRLAYSHALQADEIDQNLYSDDSRKTYGIIYDIEGQVAVPIQFYVTDSISNFFRGSLYYNDKVNPDSVKAVTENIRSDIYKLMETLEWQH